MGNRSDRFPMDRDRARRYGCRAFYVRVRGAGGAERRRRRGKRTRRRVLRRVL